MALILLLQPVRPSPESLILRVTSKVICPLSGTIIDPCWVSYQLLTIFQGGQLRIISFLIDFDENSGFTTKN